MRSKVRIGGAVTAVMMTAALVTGLVTANSASAAGLSGRTLALWARGSVSGSGSRCTLDKASWGTSDSEGKVYVAVVQECGGTARLIASISGQVRSDGKLSATYTATMFQGFWNSTGGRNWRQVDRYGSSGVFSASSTNAPNIGGTWLPNNGAVSADVTSVLFYQ